MLSLHNFAGYHCTKSGCHHADWYSEEAKVRCALAIRCVLRATTKYAKFKCYVTEKERKRAGRIIWSVKNLNCFKVNAKEAFLCDFAVASLIVLRFKCCTLKFLRHAFTFAIIDDGYMIVM